MSKYWFILTFADLSRADLQLVMFIIGAFFLITGSLMVLVLSWAGRYEVGNQFEPEEWFMEYETIPVRAYEYSETPTQSVSQASHANQALFFSPPKEQKRFGKVPTRQGSFGKRQLAEPAEMIGR